MKYDFEPIQSAADIAEQHQLRTIRLLVQALEQMADRISQLEARLDRLSDLTVGSDDQPFDEKVLQVLRVRSGSSREAVGLDDSDVERWMLSVIEENSGTVYSHIEAEIEEKLDCFSQSYGFAEAVEEAVKGSISSVVEEIIEERINPDLLESDAEDIVRKGLRSII